MGVDELPHRAFLELLVVASTGMRSSCPSHGRRQPDLAPAGAQPLGGAPVTRTGDGSYPSMECRTFPEAIVIGVGDGVPRQATASPVAPTPAPDRRWRPPTGDGLGTAACTCYPAPVRLGPLLACPALLLALSGPALAEDRAPALVRLLDRPGRAHPLADATGRIPLSVALPAGVSAASLGLLQVAPGVGAIRLPPEEVGIFAASHPALSLGVAPRLQPSLDVSGVWTHVASFQQTTGLSGRSVIVGVVDTGIDVRHPDFLTADGHTRIAWMLVGGAPVGKHPDLEAAFGCTDPKQSSCAVYAAADIDEVIANGTSALIDSDGHGTHVSSIAAGNGGVSLHTTLRYVGMAPEATLIVAAPAMDGGFVDTDILNGARFIFDRAAAMGLPAGCSGAGCVPADCAGPGCEPTPVVVNLSLGGDYGAHDGKSALEQGLSAFVGDDKPGRAIVVAAGNSGVVGTAADVIPICTGAGWTCGIHTEVHVAAHERVRVPIVAGEAESGEGFVWITFRPGDSVSVGLEGPGGKTWVGLTGPGSQGSYQGGDNQGSVVNDVPSADTEIDPASNSAVVAFTGAWAAGSELAVVLEGSGDALLWITGQKDAAENLFFERALRQGTINIPATAPALLSVGCTINRLTWTPLGGLPIQLEAFGADPSPVPDGSCYFSADGPTATGVQKPEISAPGAFVAAAMSAAADPRVAAPGGIFDMGGCPATEPFCAVVDEHHAIAAGTSMSAPHVAGAVALLMELDLTLQRDACQKMLPGLPLHRCPVTPTLTQATVTSLIQAGARRSGGHVPDPNQLGPGSLDVDGALRVLVDDSPAPTAASPGKSWYTLSSAYARPDPTWPVWGTVQLRRSDGSVATGIDGSALSVSLQHVGSLIQPLTEVRPGLFRFAVAAQPADDGETIALDVLYGGVSLGTRALPVGFDVWSASDPTLTAVSGGCAFRGAATRHGPGGLALVALAAAAGWRRRRRRCAYAAR
jgi:MYXO-CTERM domain-containing protein